MTLTRNQQLRISASRANKVADRLCARLAGYVRDSARGMRPLKIVTTHRVVSVYASGAIEQAVAPVDFTPWCDPHALSSLDQRMHVIAMDNAARARRRGEYESARESINNARILRGYSKRAEVAQSQDRDGRARGAPSEPVAVGGSPAHYARKEAASCDCCGKRRELTRTSYAGIETFACDECRGAA